MDRHNEVLTAMRPFCFYRAKDLFDLGCEGSVYAVLRSLSDGMIIEKIKDGHRNLYLSKQKSLF